MRPKRVEPQTAVEECIRVPPPVRRAPALGHEGPQPPKDPAVQPPPDLPQVANPEEPSPAAEHRIQQRYDLIHPERLIAPREVADLVSKPLYRLRPWL